MQSPLHSATRTDIHCSLTSHRSLVLYDDLLAADAGFAFALGLNSEVGLDVGCPEAHCSFERIDVPAFASELAREALSDSFVILSLRGDAELSRARKSWVEEWITNPRSESIALIVLFDPARSKSGRVSEICRWLERTAEGTGVDLFVFGADEHAGSGEVLSAERSCVIDDWSEGAEWFIGSTDALVAAS